jgi:hypothetical protein
MINACGFPLTLITHWEGDVELHVAVEQFISFSRADTVRPVNAKLKLHPFTHREQYGKRECAPVCVQTRRLTEIVDGQSNGNQEPA